MKKPLLLTFFIVLSYSLFAQQSNRDIISANGATDSLSSGTISYTVGQLVIETSQKDNITLNQGFHQGDIEVVTTYKNPDKQVEIIAYPNPAENYVELHTQLNEYKGMQYTLYDLRGALQEKGTITTTTQKIDLSQLAAGQYILQITQDDNKIQTFKIIKK